MRNHSDLNPPKVFNLACNYNDKKIMQTSELLDPNTVIVPERLRALNNDHVEFLTETIKRTQWVTPISVLKAFDPHGNETFTLIAGNHRLQACIRLGLSIPAVIEEDASKTELLEIVENFTRLDLSASEKLQHCQKLVEIYKAQGITGTNNLARLIGKSANMAERTAQRNVAQAQKIGPEVLARINGTPLDRIDF